MLFQKKSKVPLPRVQGLRCPTALTLHHTPIWRGAHQALRAWSLCRRQRISANTIITLLLYFDITIWSFYFFFVFAYLWCVALYSAAHFTQPREIALLYLFSTNSDKKLSLKTLKCFYLIYFKLFMHNVLHIHRMRVCASASHLWAHCLPAFLNESSLSFLICTSFDPFT